MDTAEEADVGSRQRSWANASGQERPLRAKGRDSVEEGRAPSAPSRVTRIDTAAHRFLVRRSLLLLRWAVGVIFVFFGALKLVPGASPAEGLVMEAIEAMTFGLVPGRAGVAFTGAIEVALGVLLVTGRLRRLTIYVLGLELIGILAPLVVLPSRLFDGVMPTLEGQYVLKDIILFAAGMVLAATIRGGRLVAGPGTAEPTKQQGDSGAVSADEKLRIVLGSIRAGHNSTDAARAHGITPQEYRRWRDELLDGAVANMASPEEHTGASSRS